MTTSQTDGYLEHQYGVHNNIYLEIFKDRKSKQDGVYLMSVLVGQIRDFLEDTNLTFDCPYCFRLFHCRSVFINNINLVCHKQAKKENVKLYHETLDKYRKVIKEAVYDFVIEELKDDYYQKFKCCN